MGRGAQDCAQASGFHDLPDHIALQLEFVAYLCAAEADASRPAIIASAALD